MRIVPASFTGCSLALSLILALDLAVTGAQAGKVTFDLRIERGQVPANMRLIRVKQGDIVMLRWNSDRPIALHLHGYDIEQQVEPGAVAEMSFTAHASGNFPVEVHKPQAGSGHTHGGSIVQIEVLPR